MFGDITSSKRDNIRWLNSSNSYGLRPGGWWFYSCGSVIVRHIIHFNTYSILIMEWNLNFTIIAPWVGFGPGCRVTSFARQRWVFSGNASQKFTGLHADADASPCPLKGYQILREGGRLGPHSHKFGTPNLSGLGQWKLVFRRFIMCSIRLHIYFMYQSWVAEGGEGSGFP